MLATPTSMNMMNAICLKNADVEKFDELYLKMKKRRNIQGVISNQNTQNYSIGPMSAAPTNGQVMSVSKASDEGGFGDAISSF
jgi:hypothetical protein